MFARKDNGASSGAGQNGSGRPSAAVVARLDVTLTNVFVSSDAADGVQIFMNARPVATGSLESLGVNVVAPSDADREGVLTGILSLYEGDERSQRSTSLFPGTVEIVARGRRIVVTCREPGSFDGIWLGLGLREDGTSTELTGVRSLRILVSPGLLDARIVWADDGVEEDLLPE